ncbi:arginine--tRNA ligase [candidate division WWE3 bacterium RIFOXYC1_FULL_39_7]|uniref:Arginine--tRNA ligase n=2 Tax=Katanobacteria TaxID=422282 RepID=A0A1F4X609_UNCKA|nr:MAG: arginine--tRNA ligase [candidate division WWE3 bacterium RIFOXYC1_FULL_39_7]OGC77059.1 MAG: arginine--tRNA ligase [candidate division WWE3 bacterium RIFOXYD1_FULL_39_9]
MQKTMNIAQLIHENIVSTVKKVYGVEVEAFIVEHPENRDFGDFSTNVSFILSKVLKQSPLEIAKKLSYELSEVKESLVDPTTNTPIFEKIDFVNPGFINFTISNVWLKYVPISIATDKKSYGSSDIGGGKRIALEHSNVNPNKAAHVGHLRNACIGQFLERAYENLGFNVEVQYYANNVGVQVVTSSMGMDKVKEIKPESYKKFDHYAWDVYAEMESRITDNPELQKERQELLLKLEDPRSEQFQKQSKLANKILLDQLKTFQELGFDYDVVIYESDILMLELWKKAFEMLKNNPNVYYATEGKSQGCWLVRLAQEDSTKNKVAEDSEDEVEEDKIIVRSNGVPTYTGKDIAYHMWKYGLLDIDFGYKKWSTDTQKKDLWVTSSLPADQNSGVSFSKVDYVYDVIGSEQTYAIDVVKRALDFLGYSKQSKNMKHINYGFVYLSKNTAKVLGMDVSDEKGFYAMKGRKGWGIKVDDLIQMVDDKLSADYGNFEYLRTVRNGAIKFQMLRPNTFQDIIFDLDEAMDMKGYSGPYVQYAYVRANSVLSKSGVDNRVFEKLDNSSLELSGREMDLLRTIYKFPEIVEKSATSFSPNILCDFLFELSKSFNAFYNDMPILNAEDEKLKNFRLSLCFGVKQVVENGLFLLGIDVPEKM